MDPQVAWWVTGISVGVAFFVALYGLFAGDRVTTRGPRSPQWLVPSPVEIRHERFPLALRGYDPAHVDVYLDALAAAYEELYFAAGPVSVARARERLAHRLGVPYEPPAAAGQPEGTAD